MNAAWGAVPSLSSRQISHCGLLSRSADVDRRALSLEAMCMCRKYEIFCDIVEARGVLGPRKRAKTWEIKDWQLRAAIAKAVFAWVQRPQFAALYYTLLDSHGI